MTSFSIMGMSITPSDGTGTPTVTALNKIICLSYMGHGKQLKIRKKCCTRSWWDATLPYYQISLSENYYSKLHSTKTSNNSKKVLKFNLQECPFHFVWSNERLYMFCCFLCFSQDQNSSIFLFQTVAKVQWWSCLHAISYLGQQRQTLWNAVSDSTYIYKNWAGKLRIIRLQHCISWYEMFFFFHTCIFI